MQVYNEQSNSWRSHRHTREYQQRKRALKTAWIFIGLTLITLPLGAQISLLLLATFISFAFLDEKPYERDRY